MRLLKQKTKYRLHRFKNIRLTPRLQAVANFVTPNSIVCDVGCDHGYVPIYLVKNKICPYVIASDILDGPLEHTKNNIELYGCGKNIQIRKGPGLSVLNTPQEADTAVIAGMGGKLIIDIISANIYINHFILQPMTAVYELRKYLNDNKYIINAETLAIEGNKIYTIISCTHNSEPLKDASYNKYQLHLGKNEDSEHFGYYKNKVISVYQKKLDGIKQSKFSQNMQSEIRNLQILIEGLKNYEGK